MLHAMAHLLLLSIIAYFNTCSGLSGFFGSSDFSGFCGLSGFFGLSAILLLGLGGCCLAFMFSKSHICFFLQNILIADAEFYFGPRRALPLLNIIGCVACFIAITLLYSLLRHGPHKNAKPCLLNHPASQNIAHTLTGHFESLGLKQIPLSKLTPATTSTHTHTN